MKRRYKAEEGDAIFDKLNLCMVSVTTELIRNTTGRVRWYPAAPLNIRAYAPEKFCLIARYRSNETGL